MKSKGEDMSNDRYLAFFNTFYGILQEASFFKGKEEIRLVDLKEDKFISDQLNIIKLHRTKILLSEKKKRVEKLSTIIDALRNEDKDELNNLLGNQYSNQAIALYNNYKRESGKDIKSIRDEKLKLTLMEILENEEES